MLNIKVSQIIIIGLLYFLGTSTAWSFGVGYYTLYRPVFAGLFVGFILENPMQGMIAGAVVNIIYLNFVSTGGTLKGDPCLTGILASIFTITCNLTYIESAALAYPFGLIGILLLQLRLKYNSKFAIMVDEEVDNGKIPNLFLYNVVYPQLILLLLSYVTIIISVYFSINIFNILGSNIQLLKKVLTQSGLLLIALSVALYLNKINNKKMIILFIVFFGAIVFYDINSIFVIIISFVVANIGLLYSNRRINNEKKDF